MAEAKKIAVTLVKSVIGTKPEHQGLLAQLELIELNLPNLK